VATPSGPVPAERLRPGDKVLGTGGDVLGVSQVLRIALPGSTFRRLDLPRPIEIAVGALGFGLPSSPLVVGPAQCLRLSGGWVRAELLVNHRTIRPVDPGLPMVALRHDGVGPFLAAGVPLGAGQDIRPDMAATVASLLRLGGSSGDRDREIEGYVDRVDRAGAFGWARDRSRPGCVVPLEVVVEGKVVAQTITDLPRPDLGGDKPVGRSLHGFRVRFPARLAAGRCWMIEIRRAAGGPALPGTPLILDAAAILPLRFDVALAAARKGEAMAARLAALVADGAERRRR
jgi:hypothetical protein